MKDQIEAAINNAGADITTRNKDVARQLVAEFDHATLFSVVSDYMRNPAVSRKAWIICIYTLCYIDPIKANQRFIEALQNDDADKRYRVVRLLAAYGTPIIVPSLIKILKDDPEPDIRYKAAIALGTIGDERALPALEWTVENDPEKEHDGIPIAAVARDAIQEIKIGPK